jgi:hypothetical protein
MTGNPPEDQIQRAIDLSRDKALLRLAFSTTRHRFEGDLQGDDRRVTLPPV